MNMLFSAKREQEQSATSDAGPPARARSFAVVVHDVAPAFLGRLVAIHRALAPRLGDRISAAVVPCWRGTPLGVGGSDAEFVRLIDEGFGEVLQHGCTHLQDRPGVISLFSGRSNELSGLSTAETRARLERGREILRRRLRSPVAGFTAPAWQAGRATTDELSRLGFEYLVAFGAIRFARKPPIPLTTWSWDWGVVGPLGRVGEWLGDGLAALRPDASPCVVIHPADVDRGYLPRSLGVIDGLLRAGRVPVLFGDLAAVPTEGPAR
ncbi:hypothetical protein VT85_02810 [Planctomyces sp. SH-PL62]|nr:hypothetical protein VT85_02810 [Planctomyces sp. SH-PL62]